MNHQATRNSREIERDLLIWGRVNVWRTLGIKNELVEMILKAHPTKNSFFHEKVLGVRILITLSPKKNLPWFS